MGGGLGDLSNPSTRSDAKVVDDVRGSRGVAVALRVKEESQVEVRASPVVRVFDRCTRELNLAEGWHDCGP